MFGKALVTLWLLAVPAVALAETRVDFDRHKDFSRYRTFTVQIEPPVRADGIVDEQNTLAESRLRQAIIAEFQARGLEPTDVGADLVVQVSSRETERTVLYNTGWYGHPWGPYSYRRYGRWGYWGRGYWGPYGDVWTRRYLEGAVTIDIVERASGQLVYRAQVSDEIGDNLDKQVIKTVDKAFKKYPVKEVESD